MKWLLFGVLLGVLLVYPALMSLVIGGVAAIASQPVVLAFALGLAARPHLHRPRGWTR
ncbi:hypothetical protein RM704_15630 [Streptomyces sp. DSM 3412]|uniref:Uncharacterized protein n=1 Tax=Streptomyces gottesmaniae TaxID=3075518 RepID=A0ABU2YX21_9ACTN|nr:hypothetical protein [Streptomyces sp. DSM 3412]MDT0568883.1 hypothetical protein [Streptomyces sp. DSM 3412]